MILQGYSLPACVYPAGAAGGFPGGVCLADIPVHGSLGGKSKPASCLLSLDSCLWFLVSCLSRFHGWEIVPLDEACRWHAGWGDSGSLAVGTVGWDETSRCDGGSGCAAVLGYLLFVIWGMRFSSTTHDPPSPISDPLRVFAVNLSGEGETGMPTRDAPATDWGEDAQATGNPRFLIPNPRSTISDLRSPSRPWRLCGESFRRGRT